MTKTTFDVRGILAGEAPADAPVTVKGWVRTRRDSKAGISFVHLSDGSCFHPVQVVAPNTLPNYADEILKLTAGCAIEATGTIVMGENVRISTVAVAQGNLVVKVEETPQVSQPNPFAPEGAATTVVPRSDITVDEEAGNKVAVLQEGATLKELVAGLNALGVGPRDLITILQTIKAAGALQADIETR